jgi:hypothetical protein
MVKGLAAAAGEYTVDVIIGDSAVQDAVVWTIGKVAITPPAPAPKPDEVRCRHVAGTAASVCVRQ